MTIYIKKITVLYQIEWNKDIEINVDFTETDKSIKLLGYVMPDCGDKYSGQYNELNMTIQKRWINYCYNTGKLTYTPQGIGGEFFYLYQ